MLSTFYNILLIVAILPIIIILQNNINVNRISRITRYSVKKYCISQKKSVYLKVTTQLRSHKGGINAKIIWYGRDTGQGKC